MSDLHAAILDALYNEYGKYIALAERTSHNTRWDYKNKAEGVLTAIRTVEGFDMEYVDRKNS